MIKVKGYNFSRPFMGERVPQHIQNIVIKEFCKKNNLFLQLSATEYSMKNSYLILKGILKDFGEIDGIVAYSLFQLPEERKNRLSIYKKLLLKKKFFYFACENLQIGMKKDIDRIENIWLVKQLIQN